MKKQTLCALLLATAAIGCGRDRAVPAQSVSGYTFSPGTDTYGNRVFSFEAENDAQSPFLIEVTQDFEEYTSGAIQRTAKPDSQWCYWGIPAEREQPCTAHERRVAANLVGEAERKYGQ